MKNPLIEALRQASEDSSASQQPADTETRVEIAGDPANDEHVVDAEELALMETVSSLEVEVPDMQSGSEAGDTVPDGVSEASEDPIHEPAPTEAPSNVGVRVFHGQALRGLPALGRFAPLLCLLSALTAAAIYMTYQALGGGFDGSGLAVMSARVLAEGRPSDSGDAGSEPPPSPFALQQPLPEPSARAPGPAPISRNEAPGREGTSPTGGRPIQRVAPMDAIVDEAFPILQVAYKAFEAGDLDAAEAGYRRALEVVPRHPNALEGLGALLMKTDRHGEALDTFQALLSVDPDNAAAAAALLGASRSEDATATASDLKHLVQLHPDSPHLRFALGAHYASDDRWPEARLEFEQAHSLDPASAEYLYNLAVVLEHLGQTANAAKHYELALATISTTSSVDAAQVTARLESIASPENSRERIQ